MNPVPAAIFISGRGSNMEALIQSTRTGALCGLCEVTLVLSNRENAAGIDKAKALGTRTVFVPSKGRSREEFEQAAMYECVNAHVQFILLAGFDRILSPVLVRRFQGRIINIHPADTRAYQGLNGYAWAFEQSLETTKITIHFVDEGVDTGAIIEQADVDLRGAKSLEEVARRGLARENVFYAEALARFFRRQVTNSPIEGKN